ncbi:lipopolysaccharide-binding protein-like [Clavelina lepadiformis]|uniref:lipopolysaccharide-binding protein-like n=1 Tax=Clavelina lepadiformis TaxID=159417 RepID=UPI0040418A20
MKIYKVFVTFVCIAVIANFAASQGQEHPGLKVRVSTSGLNFLKDLVIDAVDDQLRSVRLPNVKGKDFVNYEIKNIVASKIRLGGTSVRTIRPNIFQARANGAGMDVNAEWEVSRKIKIPFVPNINLKGSGRLQARTSNVDIQQSIIVERTATGKPKFTVADCSVRIGSFSSKIDVNKLPSQISRALNVLVDLFENLIKKEIQQMVCGLIRPGLQSLGQKLTRNFELTFPLFLGTKIDLGLACDPSSTGSNGLVCLNGNIFPDGQSDVAFPFAAPELPMTSASSHMARISISPYVPNTLLHSLYLENRLKQTFTPENIASIFHVSLPVGAIVPFLKPLFGDNLPPVGLYASLLQFTVEATDSPRALFTPVGVEVSGSFKITLSAAGENGPQKLLDLSFSAMALVGVTVQKGKIKALIKSV